MRRNVGLALFIVSACSRPASDAPPPQIDAGIVGLATSVSDAALPADASDTPEAARAEFAAAFSTALPVRGKSIGHTSIVFKLGLAGDLNAAYKPRSHVGGERFRAEIAAFRLGVAWQLLDVPAAIPRSFPADALRGALDEKASDVFSKEVVIESDGTVRGALIPWIPKLEFLPLENSEWRAKWGTWLDATDAGQLLACDADLASQISTMILFDTMTGNWDRWSGGNIGVARATTGGCDRVLYIDNDGAFFDPVPAALLASQLSLVKKMTRFSRSFVTQLLAISETDLQKAIGDEVPGKPLLSQKIVDAFFARRKTVLANIDAKITTNGDAMTLSLP